MSTRQIFLDTETTGLSAADGDRVIEIACVEMVDRRLTGRHFHYYVNPQRESHPDALAIHGLTTAFLADKPLFPAIAQELLAFVAGAEVLIHNAAFDVGFVNAELALAGLPAFEAQVAQITDTVLLARRLYPGQQASLDALCRRLGVDNSSRTLHGALLDAQLLAEVYIGMTRGQNSLLGEASSATPQAGVQGDGKREDLSHLVLPVLTANAQELDAHHAVLADMAKKAKLVWA